MGHEGDQATMLVGLLIAALVRQSWLSRQTQQIRSRHGVPPRRAAAAT
jgi:hypothetical protein